MTTEHPITLPPELLDNWLTQWAANNDVTGPQVEYVATQAARWGWEQRGAANEAELQKARDEELEACIKLLSDLGGDGDMLRRNRRPKPPSLKKQALETLASADGADCPVVATVLTADQHALIRRALEALPDD